MNDLAAMPDTHHARSGRDPDGATETRLPYWRLRIWMPPALFWKIDAGPVWWEGAKTTRVLFQNQKSAIRW